MRQPSRFATTASVRLIAKVQETWNLIPSLFRGRRRGRWVGVNKKESLSASVRDFRRPHLVPFLPVQADQGKYPVNINMRYRMLQIAVRDLQRTITAPFMLTGVRSVNFIKAWTGRKAQFHKRGTSR
jgi:hypothetical protein